MTHFSAHLRLYLQMIDIPSYVIQIILESYLRLDVHLSYSLYPARLSSFATIEHRAAFPAPAPCVVTASSVTRSS